MGAPTVFRFMRCAHGRNDPSGPVLGHRRRRALRPGRHHRRVQPGDRLPDLRSLLAPRRHHRVRCCLPCPHLRACAHTMPRRPLMGGAFADPASKFPRWFASEFWRAYPYFLPGAVAAATAFLAIMLAYAFLEEVRPSSHALPSVSPALTPGFADPALQDRRGPRAPLCRLRRDDTSEWREHQCACARVLPARAPRVPAPARALRVRLRALVRRQRLRRPLRPLLFHARRQRRPRLFRAFPLPPASPPRANPRGR